MAARGVPALRLPALVRDAPLATALAAETVHGGQVLAFNDAGAVRLCSRDGLAHLRDLDPPKITPAELSAGLAYRAVYEITASDLRSQLGGGVGGGADHEAFVGSRYLRAKATKVRQQIEAAVVAAPPHASRYRYGLSGLNVLRMVAGEGRALSSLSGGSGSRGVMLLAALKQALAVVAAVLAGR